MTEQGNALDAATDAFIQSASLALIEEALGCLDGDDADLVPRVVDALVERVRAELVEAVTVGIVEG